MAGGMTLGDVMAALYDRLAGAYPDADVAVYPTRPEVEGTLPAVWPEAVMGGGTNTRDRPATVRVRYVPNPAAGNADADRAVWAAIDTLDDHLAAPLPGGVTFSARSWAASDGVTIGDVTRDCLSYDVTLTYPTC